MILFTLKQQDLRDLVFMKKKRERATKCSHTIRMSNEVKQLQYLSPSSLPSKDCAFHSAKPSLLPKKLSDTFDGHTSFSSRPISVKSSELHC